MSELKIVATLFVKEAFREELMPVFRAVVDATRREKGNVSYELHRDMQNPLKFIFIEVWESQAAIDLHNASAHFQAFAQAIDGKTDNLTIDVMEKVL